MGNHAGEGLQQGKISNVEELRQRIVDEWERFDQRIIDGAMKEWRKLRACAAAEGGQFEHQLWLLVQQCCVVATVHYDFAV